MSEENILIVEDEARIARVISLELQHEGYVTESVSTGQKALRKLSSTSWDLILLDIMLPEMSGMEVLRRLRAENNTVPVIILTAKDTTPDKVSGLDLGANDYVTKPFEIEELLARIRACLRSYQSQQQSSPFESHTIMVGDLTVNLNTRMVQREDQSIDLTPKEFDLLTYLMKNENQVLEREQIIVNVWGYDYVGETNVVDVYIRYLRRKIDKGFQQSYIQTIRGVGYSMRADPS
ncbi:two-component system response regulator YkoG [Barrientosiimonas marina]|uniref:Response regulator transcription factor n=1 Tax=Lentibacillus kimchii TaxID=1542911 RepID=A0ABW2UW17_9BACI